MVDGARRGYYSHVYAEAGFLAGSSARISRAYPRSATHALFDLASLSKALATAPLCLRHFSNDLTTPWYALLDATAKKVLDTTNIWWMNCSLEALLSHDSGLPAWRNLWVNRLGKRCQRKLSYTQRFKILIESLQRSLGSQTLPHSQNCYSDLGYLILGSLLETKFQAPLSELFANHLKDLSSDLMGLHLGYAHAMESWQAHFVPSAYCNIRERLLVGEVHDENAASLGGVCGHTGLFGSGPQLGRYIRTLFASTWGQQWLQLAHQRSRSGQHPPGLRLGDDFAAQGFARQSMLLGHWGFTGTAFWIDPVDNRYAVILSNRVLHHRLLPVFKDFRHQVLNLLADALEKPSDP